MNHTPLPWKIDGKYLTDQTGLCTIAILPVIGPIEVSEQNKLGDLIHPDNAAFIIEACNNYERLQAENARLREACDIAQRYIGLATNRDDFDEIDWDSIYKQLRSALKLPLSPRLPSP